MKGIALVLHITILSFAILFINTNMNSSFAQNNTQQTENVTVSQDENVSVITDGIQLDVNVTDNGTIVIDPEDQYLPQLADNRTNVTVTENGTVIIEPPSQPQGANQTANILDQISEAFSNLFGG